MPQHPGASVHLLSTWELLTCSVLPTITECFQTIALASDSYLNFTFPLRLAVSPLFLSINNPSIPLVMQVQSHWVIIDFLILHMQSPNWVHSFMIMALIGLVLSIISGAFSLVTPLPFSCSVLAVKSVVLPALCSCLSFPTVFPTLPSRPQLYFKSFMSEMEFISCPRSTLAPVPWSSTHGNGHVSCVPCIFLSQLTRLAFYTFRMPSVFCSPAAATLVWVLVTCLPGVLWFPPCPLPCLFLISFFFSSSSFLRDNGVIFLTHGSISVIYCFQTVKLSTTGRIKIKLFHLVFRFRKFSLPAVIHLRAPATS